MLLHELDAFDRARRRAPADQQAGHTGTIRDAENTQPAWHRSARRASAPNEPGVQSELHEPDNGCTGEIVREEMRAACFLSYRERDADGDRRRQHPARQQARAIAEYEIETDQREA